MSKLSVTYNEINKILKIEKQTSRKNIDNIFEVDLNTINSNKEKNVPIRLTNIEDRKKIIFFKVIENVETTSIDDEEESDENENQNLKKVIMVYTDNKNIKYAYCDLESAYKKIIKLKFKVGRIKLNKKYLSLNVLAFLVNPYNIEIKDTKFYIDDELYKKCTLKQYSQNINKLKMLQDKNILRFKFKVDDIIKDESMINGVIKFSLCIDGYEIPYRIAVKKKKIKNKKYYYAPMKAIYKDNFAIHIRRSLSGNLVLVKRLKTPIEDKLSFRIKESKIVSKFFSIIGKIRKKLSKKPINLYFEKYSAKAEEGAYNLFLMARNSKNSKNYFIIDPISPDYEKIKNEKNVVKKYSLKYYWLVYSSKNFITTEAPIHVTELRGNNKTLRLALYDKKFVFLQHGVTYMKRHDKNSAYIVGREAEPDYIVAGSEKEKDIIVEMLKLSEDRVLKTGLPIFSNIEYKHINENSEDYITIMLTWKPYEEHLYNFEESTYYKNVVEICNMLKKYTTTEKIIIISHPKAYDLLNNTDLGESQWQQPISEALKKTKLMITDYSSVCYNSFYQGAGVIFYQPDLDFYENDNGTLIPTDEEYVGKRAFDINELENIIKQSVKNGKIDLSKLRTKEHEENYKLINEFSDGKNIERIYEELKKLKFI